MRKFLLFLILALVPAQFYAQSPAKILKRAEAAVGGAKAIQGVRSVEKMGAITRRSDGVSGRFSMISARSDLYSFGYDLGGLEIAYGYNGKSVWTRDSRSGQRTLTGDAAAIFRAEAIYRNSLWLDYKKNRVKPVAGGRGEAAGRPAKIVVLKSAGGADVRLFFDDVTGLPVREEFSSGERTAIYEYADFRRVGALTQPFRITYTADNAVFDIIVDNVYLDKPISLGRFDFPKISDEPLPDIRSLLVEVANNQGRVESLLESYAYTERRASRDAAKDGSLVEKESETMQVSFYKGRRVDRLVAKNDRPLSESEQRAADAAAAKQIEAIDAMLARQQKNSAEGKDDSDDRISLSEILRASNLANPRRERFRGRDVIVFDFEPNPAFDYKNAKSLLKYFGKVAGVIWIDAADKQIARVEAVLADSIKIGGGLVAKLKKGASFTLEQDRFNNEIWLPSFADINLSVRLFLVKGLDLNEIVRSYDYRIFKTEVKGAQVNEAAKP